MKNIAVVLVIILVLYVLTGCNATDDTGGNLVLTPSAESVSQPVFESNPPSPQPKSDDLKVTETEKPLSENIDSDPDTLINMPAGVESTVPDNQGNESEKSYDELKDEFERIVEIAESGVEISIWEIAKIFEEMLNFRQSVEYFSESLEFSGWRYSYGKPSIVVGSIFTDGNVNCRVITLFGLLPVHRIYVQIFDEESIQSQCIYAYYIEGGASGGKIHFDFRQHPEKILLNMIFWEYSIAWSDLDETYEGYNHYVIMVNCEISGNEITYYSALRNNISDGIWKIEKVLLNDTFLFSDPIVVTQISQTCSWPFETINEEPTFEDDILTIVLNNADNDKISLLFIDGFWEVVEIK